MDHQELVGEGLMAGPRSSHTTHRGRGPGVEPGSLRLLVIGQHAFLTHALPAAGSVVLGRGEGSTIVIDDGSISRRHARLQLGPRMSIEDLGSANGTRLRDRLLEPGRPEPLAPGEVVRLGEVLVIIQPSTVAVRPLRVWSHGYFEVRIEEECARAELTGNAFAVLRLHGPGDAPDEVFQRTLAELLRDVDVVGAYGPGDYEVLLAATAPEEAAATARNVVGALARRGLVARAGLACWPTDGRGADELMARAGAVALGETAPARSGHELSDGGAMKELRLLVDRVAASTISVLILGETGVGKEVLSEAVHRASPRRERPFLRLNCAALSETLLESELFGHERGAFTGAVQAKQGLLETADGGTVFLDEVGDLPLNIQVKLLRVIEERQVLRVGGLKSRAIDVRFVAATNRDLEAAVAAGEFRQDLYFRLAGVTLVIPPLRERVSEIDGLAKSFIANACRKFEREAVPTISAEAKRLLLAYTWPGNIRELRNVCERAVLLCAHGVIGAEHLPVEKMRATVAATRSLEPAEPADGAEEVSAVEEARALPVTGVEDDGATVIEVARREAAVVERRRIVEALARAGGNQTRAAALLRISRRTLMKKLDKYGILRPRKSRRGAPEA